MSARRILLTGAAGFVGRHMLAVLRKTCPRSHIAGAVRREDAAHVPDVDEVVEFDLLQPGSVGTMVRQVRPDLCVHLAAMADVAGSFLDPDLVWRANVDGTRALAAMLMLHAPACFLLHASSAEVYGLSFQAGHILDEAAPMQPANPYAAAKAASDLALGEMALRGLRVIRMRPLNHVGPGQSPHFVVAAFARQIARIEAGLQEPVIQTGALDRARDFLDVRDVCAAYGVAIAKADGLPNGAAFNLASGQPRCIRDILLALLALSGVEAAVETATSAIRPVDIAETSCSAATARNALGWRPCIPWERTLLDVLDDWRERVRSDRVA